MLFRSDGHRLAVCTIELDQDLQTHSVILPRKGVLELNRLLESSDELARLQIGTNNLHGMIIISGFALIKSSRVPLSKGPKPN